MEILSIIAMAIASLLNIAGVLHNNKIRKDLEKRNLNVLNTSISVKDILSGEVIVENHIDIGKYLSNASLELDISMMILVEDMIANPHDYTVTRDYCSHSDELNRLSIYDYRIHHSKSNTIIRTISYLSRVTISNKDFDNAGLLLIIMNSVAEEIYKSHKVIAENYIPQINKQKLYADESRNAY